ncbi:MAG: LysM peptidoglycan-binding domain-containing protein [Cellulosilyticaceae bacterium]
MDVYLSFNDDKQMLRLPVTPSEFNIEEVQNNSSVNITNLGEINLIGKKGLVTMSLESFFPANPYYFCRYQDFPKPYDCVKLIKSWKASGKPIRVRITRGDTKHSFVNYAVAIESFSYGEHDGSGDVYFSLKLKEYVFIKAVKAQITNTSSGTNVSRPPTKRETKGIAKSYTVKKGDTLYGIAKKLTGDATNAKAIAKRNKIKDMNKIYAGQVLVI